MMTIEEIKELKITANLKTLEVIDLAIKFKQIPDNLGLMRNLKSKIIPTLGFKQRGIKRKLKIEIELLEQLIKHIAD